MVLVNASTEIGGQKAEERRNPLLSNKRTSFLQNKIALFDVFINAELSHFGITIQKVVGFYRLLEADIN